MASQGNRINYGAVVLYSLIGAVVTIGILYFLGTRIPFFSPVTKMLDGVWLSVSGVLGRISFGDFSLSQFITDHIGEIVGFAFTGIATLIGIVSVRAKQKQNEELLEQYKSLDLEKLNLENQKDALLGSLTDKEAEIKNQAGALQMYAEDTTATQLQGRINELQLMLQGKQDLVMSLEKRVSELTTSLEARPVIEKEVYK